jgi:hypothetical protein
MTVALVRPIRALPSFASAWAGSFAALHLFWAMGGRVGVPRSAAPISERPVFLAYDLLAAGLLSVAAVLAGRATLARRVRFIVTAAALLALMRGAGALLQDALYLVLDRRPGGFAFGVLYDCWFVVAGVSFFVLVRRHVGNRRPAPPVAAAQTLRR